MPLANLLILHSLSIERFRTNERMSEWMNEWTDEWMWAGALGKAKYLRYKPAGTAKLWKATILRTQLSMVALKLHYLQKKHKK